MLAAQIVTIVLLGLVARAPELGIFLLCQSVAQTFAAVATLRFDSALPAARSVVEQAALLICATVAMVVSSLFVFLLVLGGGALNLFELDQVPMIGAALIGALTLGTAAGQMGRYFQIRVQDLIKIERGTYVRGGLMIALRGIIIVFLVLSPNGLVAAHQGILLLASEVLISFGFAATVMPKLASGAFENARRPRPLRATIRRNWKFPTLETPSALMDSLANNAPIYLVTQFFGLTATAAFGLAFRAMVVPIGQLALALTEVLQSHYAELLRSNRLEAFTYLFRRSSLICAVLGLIGCIVTFFFAVPVATLVAGEKLHLFAQICVTIAPWIAMNVLVNINSRLVALLRVQELKLIYDFVSIVAMIAAFVAQVVFEFDLLGFVLILTIAQVLTYCVYWLLLNHAVNRTARVFGTAKLATR